jgi:hypothetical protein
MDDHDEVQEKIHDAMRAAIEEAKRRGLGIDDAMQFVADALINHSDRDVVAFQEGHNKRALRYLN